MKQLQPLGCRPFEQRAHHLSGIELQLKHQRMLIRVLGELFFVA